MSRATDDLSDGPEGRLSRREVVRLVSGAIAMSAALGVPASLRAEAYQGGKGRPQCRVAGYRFCARERVRSPTDATAAIGAATESAYP